MEERGLWDGNPSKISRRLSLPARGHLQYVYHGVGKQLGRKEPLILGTLIWQAKLCPKTFLSSAVGALGHSNIDIWQHQWCLRLETVTAW